MPEKYYLQNRWKAEGNKLYYYGLRNGKNLFKNSIKLSSSEMKIISSLPRDLSDEEYDRLKKYIGIQIVREKDLKKFPDHSVKLSSAKIAVQTISLFPGLNLMKTESAPSALQKRKPPV